MNSVTDNTLCDAQITVKHILTPAVNYIRISVTVQDSRNQEMKELNKYEGTKQIRQYEQEERQ